VAEERTLTDARVFDTASVTEDDAEYAQDAFKAMLYELRAVACGEPLFTSGLGIADRVAAVLRSFRANRAVWEDVAQLRPGAFRALFSHMANVLGEWSDDPADGLRLRIAVFITMVLRPVFPMLDSMLENIDRNPEHPLKAHVYGDTATRRRLLTYFLINVPERPFTLEHIDAVLRTVTLIGNELRIAV
jgi:hypothetical protein